jgi:membrane protein DedA with SNARE-associated domain/rhodanese-related sulfurtransferase
LARRARAAQDEPMQSPVGLGVVFLNVLCTQLGLPLPAMPTLVVAGAMAAQGRLPATPLYALAVLACLIGDSVWYCAGRLYGARVMRVLCRISLTPDTCVSDTQASFERWGSKVLIVAKFVPGLGLVAPPLAGATRMGPVRFLAYSLLAALLWAGVGIMLGLLLRAQIARLWPVLASLGGVTLLLALVLLLAYILYKWWERYRFYRALNVARIDVGELHAQLRTPSPPVVLDVRSLTARTFETRRIPGALHVPVQSVNEHAPRLPRDRDIILYCNCPNEASAALAAKVLMSHGFRRVRPLRGGLDAWIAAGYQIEEVAAPPAGEPAPQLAASVGDSLSRP